MKHTTLPAAPGMQALRRMMLLAPLALLLGTVAPARAANLDEALLKASPAILTYLKEEGYKNVGVLPFKVKKIAREASYLAGPLASNLPGRLENALIMGQGSNENRAVGIIRDAATTANKEKIGSYTKDPVAFRKLFDAQYKLAWGKKKVKADAFVTGVVNNTGDRSKTTLQVQVFTAKSREGKTIQLIDVGKPIVVKTDRSLLRDLGYTYALSRSVLKRGVTAQKRDEAAVQQVSLQENGIRTQLAQQDSAVTPENIAGMEFELLYNGGKQELRPYSQGGQGAKSPKFQADPIPEGAIVTMNLIRRLAEDRRLGVVLKVNGRSTFQEEEVESIRCRKWIYDLNVKDKPDEFLGFYTDTTGKNLKKFQVLSAEESAVRANELGDRAGWIDIDVYASGEADPQLGGAAPGADREQPKQSEGDEPEMKVSTRGLARARKVYPTLKDLQDSLRKANRVKLKKSLVVPRGPGGLLLPENEPSDEVTIEQSSLPNPIHLGGISVQYYERAAGGKPNEE